METIHYEAEPALSASATPCPRSSLGHPADHIENDPPRLAVGYRPAAALIPFAKNARTHSDAQVAQIAGSIREFGWTNPILVDGENGVIAGHGRLLAARKLRMGDVPVIELAGASARRRSGR